MPIPNNILDEDRLLTEVQAADLLRLSARTLQAWRCRGIGPPFVRAGRAIRYRRRDLVAWAEENTVVPRSASRSPPPSLNRSALIGRPEQLEQQGSTANACAARNSMPRL